MIGEFLVTLLVGFIVFGPKKLPMLATHIALLIRKITRLKSQAIALWVQQLNELKLYENQQKAQDAEKHYSKMNQDS